MRGASRSMINDPCAMLDAELPSANEISSKLGGNGRSITVAFANRACPQCWLRLWSLRTQMAKLMRTKAAAFVLLLSAASAHAQQPQTDSPARTQATIPVFGIDDAALAGSARASKLIGSKVYTGDTSIGQIEDVLVTLDRATVTGVILSVGGFLGIGDKLVAVPVDQIKLGPEARFITTLTKEQLANAPAFDFAKLK